MTKHVKRNTNKPQKLAIWLGKAIAATNARPVLTYIHKTEGNTEVTDGYRIHRTTEENDYEVGLTPTDKSEVLKEGTNFPPTDVVFPKRFDNISKVRTIDLINALQRALIFAKDSANCVTIKAVYAEMAIIGKSAERGDCDTSIKAKTESLKHQEYRMNGRYMLDALNGMKNLETVILKYDGHMLLIDGGIRQALIMGMR